MDGADDLSSRKGKENESREKTRQFNRVDLNETDKMLDLIEAIMKNDSSISQHMFIEDTDRIYCIICYSSGYGKN